MYGLGTSNARISEVLSVVCAGERVTLADMRSKSRRRCLAIPRQYAMRLARELTGHSYPSLGKYFGDRDHTTILHGDRKIKTLEACSPPTAEKLAGYRRQVAALVTERLAALGGCSSQWSPPPSEMPMLRPTVTTVTMGMAA